MEKQFHYLHYVSLLTNVHQWATTQILYISGIMLFRGPFRPYTSDNARSFIADVMDGYFPAEFKDKYPDGVAFEIKDSSDKTYDDQMKEHEANEESGSFKVFGGVGKTLNSPKMKTQEFLNRLPEKIICGGEVIPIRKDIADRLAVTAENTKNVGMRLIAETCSSLTSTKRIPWTSTCERMKAGLLVLRALPQYTRSAAHLLAAKNEWIVYGKLRCRY